MSIGSKIKALRRAKDLTQEELAEVLGVSSKAVSQWECGRTAPDISQLPVLCNFFGGQEFAPLLKAQLFTMKRLSLWQTFSISNLTDIFIPE